jgi:hypothetical protein
MMLWTACLAALIAAILAKRYLIKAPTPKIDIATMSKFEGALR